MPDYEGRPIVRGLAFEQFVRNVASTITGGSVEPNSTTAARDLGVDIVVGDSGPGLTLIEARSDAPATRTRLALVTERLQHAAKSSPLTREARLVLASPGLLSDERLQMLKDAGVDYWSGLTLVRAAREAGVEVPQGLGLPVGNVPEEPPELALRERLEKTLPGTENWSTYQAWCRDALEYLFVPPLNTPTYELETSNGHNRRDIILANYAETGYWYFLRLHYHADYVVVDAKNSKHDVKKADVLQLANYLSPRGAGLFGMIICRRGPDKAAVWTIREQWIMHKKLIVVLNDEDMVQMLEARQIGAEPETLLRQKIEDFRLSI